MDVQDDLESLSLLQLRANATRAESTGSFGCTGKGNAANVLKCGLWGDPHLHCKFGQPCVGGTAYGPPVNYMGWYWLARSTDKSENGFALQAFMDAPPGPSSIIALAGRFGKTRFEMIKAPKSQWETWKIRGDPVPESTFPQSFQDGTYIKRLGTRIFHLTPDEADPASACIESPDHEISLKAAAYVWAGGGPSYPGGYPINLELEVDSSYDLDMSFGLCNQNPNPVAAADLLVSPEGQNHTCTIKRWTGTCDDPPPPPPIEPEPEEVCEEHHLNIAKGEEACADQKKHGDDMYQSCLFDWCTSGGMDSSSNGANLMNQISDPVPECQVNDKTCHHCKTCKTSVNVDLTNVGSNNLGGQGPGKGAEEIRYKHALSVNGQSVDIVLTAKTDFLLQDPKRNGVEGKIGRIAVTCGSSTDLEFKFEDSTTGEAVAVDNLALTFYDIDEGKKGRGREGVSVCGPDEVYTMSDTELVPSKTGDCYGYASGTKGSGKDNPTDPSDLSAEQLAKSVTYTFSGKSTLKWQAEAGGGCGGKIKQRAVMFAFVPAVACGTDEAEEGKCKGR